MINFVKPKPIMFYTLKQRHPHYNDELCQAMNNYVSNQAVAELLQASGLEFTQVEKKSKNPKVSSQVRLKICKIQKFAVK